MERKEIIDFPQFGERKISIFCWGSKLHTSFCNSKRFVSWEEIGSSGLHRLQGVLLLCETNVERWPATDKLFPSFLDTWHWVACLNHSMNMYELCLVNASTCINDLVNLMMLLPSFAQNSSDFAISCPPGPPGPNFNLSNHVVWCISATAIHFHTDTATVPAGHTVWKLGCFRCPYFPCFFFATSLFFKRLGLMAKKITLSHEYHWTDAVIRRVDAINWAGNDIGQLDNVSEVCDPQNSCKITSQILLCNSQSCQKFTSSTVRSLTPMGTKIKSGDFS